MKADIELEKIDPYYAEKFNPSLLQQVHCSLGEKGNFRFKEPLFIKSRFKESLFITLLDFC